MQSSFSVRKRRHPIAQLEEKISSLQDEKAELLREKNQAVLDAKRALSSSSMFTKSAKEALQARQMAEADRNAAYQTHGRGSGGPNSSREGGQ